MRVGAIRNSLGRYSCSQGFTLAELLLALLILAVIAAYSIPKILIAQTNGTYNSAAKELAGAMSQAFQQYQMNHVVDGTTKVKDVAVYLNYVSVISTGVPMDDIQGGTSTPVCDGTGYICLKLHNGGVLHYGINAGFGSDPVKNNGMSFQFDPDGKLTDSTTNNAAKSVQLWIYGNGHLMTRGTQLANSCDVGGCNATAWPPSDPPWLTW